MLISLLIAVGAFRSRAMSSAQSGVSCDAFIVLPLKRGDDRGPPRFAHGRPRHPVFLVGYEDHSGHRTLSLHRTARDDSVSMNPISTPDVNQDLPDALGGTTVELTLKFYHTSVSKR
jgi:hypothetical protein